MHFFTDVVEEVWRFMFSLLWVLLKTNTTYEGLGLVKNSNEKNDLSGKRIINDNFPPTFFGASGSLILQICLIYYVM